MNRLEKLCKVLFFRQRNVQDRFDRFDRKGEGRRRKFLECFILLNFIAINLYITFLCIPAKTQINM